MSGFSKSPGTITKVYKRPGDGYFLTVAVAGKSTGGPLKEPNGETTLTITNNQSSLYRNTDTVTTNIFSTNVENNHEWKSTHRIFRDVSMPEHVLNTQRRGTCSMSKTPN